MAKIWNTTTIPLNNRLILWIKSKIEGTKTGTVIIDIRDSKVVSIHYQKSEFVLDVDTLEN